MSPGASDGKLESALLQEMRSSVKNELIRSDDPVAYHGVFQADNEQERRVTFQDRTLVFHEQGGGKFALIEQGNGRYEFDDQFTVFKFSRDK